MRGLIRHRDRHRDWHRQPWAASVFPNAILTALLAGISTCLFVSFHFLSVISTSAPDLQLKLNGFVVRGQQRGGNDNPNKIGLGIHNGLLSASSPLLLSWRSHPSLLLLMEEVIKSTTAPETATGSGSHKSADEICGKFPNVFGNRSSILPDNRKRRIFAGTLIADDSWHAIGAGALEAHGLFHSITLVESNRTQSFSPRPLRFAEGSDERRVLEHIYGPATIVRFARYVNEDRHLRNLNRERQMRDRILREWKALGMKRDDIGWMMDPDELISRNFLEALLVCKINDQRLGQATSGVWNAGDTTGEYNSETCRNPGLRLGVPMWEGSPDCIQQSNDTEDGLFHWLRSKMVVGACIEGIGDVALHPPIQRDGVARPPGFGWMNNYSKIPNGVNGTGYYPLYNGVDFRNVGGNLRYGGLGYHLHNFFVDPKALRFKYQTYGHPVKHAYGDNAIPLGALNPDMNVLVKCAHGIDDTGSGKRRVKNGLEHFKRLSKNYENIDKSNNNKNTNQNYITLPLAFQIPGYVESRHKELIAMVQQDEEEYGRADRYDGHHMYKEHMLTHKGRQHKEINEEERLKQ